MVKIDNYEQQSIFGFPEYKITKKIRLIEMFGGIGSQAMALRDIGADFEHHRLIEFDKYCVQSYNAIHHTNFVPMDIRNVHGKDLDVRERERLSHRHCKTFPKYKGNSRTIRVSFQKQRTQSLCFRISK